MRGVSDESGPRPPDGAPTPARASIGSRIDRWPFLRALFGWKAHILELALFLGAYIVYLATRGLVFPDTYATGVENAGRVVSLEKSAGFFWEPGWQAWAIDNAKGLVIFFNWVYIITYWPIVLLLALLLYVVNRRRYYYYRTVVVLTLAVALVVFMLFPVASPFNLPAYLADTIQDYGPSYYGSPEMTTYYNTNAAMPSLHFSWTVILGVLFFRTWKGYFRFAGVLYPVLTFFAITLTGNHFILDAIAGGALAALAFAVMELGVKRRLFLKRFRLGRMGRPWAISTRPWGRVTTREALISRRKV